MATQTQSMDRTQRILEIVQQESVLVRVHNPTKAVANCFKYRNKIWLDVALEALCDCRRRRRCTNDELWHYAKICRVANVMRPYMEATTQNGQPTNLPTSIHQRLLNLSWDRGEDFNLTLPVRVP